MLLVVRAFCLSLAVAAMLSTPAPGAAGTTVVVFRPWANGALMSGFTVLRKASGYCFTHSLATDRPDAWRCFEGNDILDPCFARSAHSFKAACAQTPFSRAVVLLSLSKPLSDSNYPVTKWLQPKAMPWGLRLASGDSCVFVTGATDVVDGDRLNYVCRKTGWIIGAPDRSTATWTARSAAWPNKHVTIVRIATAIF
jgi:hypothetical protein